jgi:MFS transporter, PAT family, beta-lactamase induction signal transducer AmpG
MATEKPTNCNPWIWVPTIYFAEGLPYTIVNLVSVVFFKNLGASNELIGLTSILYLPWVLKGFWGPVVDIYSTRRRWILRLELLSAALFLCLAFIVFEPNILTASIICFAFIAFVSATHDIAIDGFYLDALNKNDQALFVGVRSTAYKFSWLFGNGALVFLAGFIAQQYVIGANADGKMVYGNVELLLAGFHISISAVAFGWAVAFAVCGILFLLIYLFQFFYLPYPETRSAKSDEPQVKHNFFEAFKTYFTQVRIGWIVLYVLIFRLGDALMLKMTPPFLMDPIENGGMAISTKEIGILNGTVGTISLLAGGILGGVLIAKQGLRRWMWPTALMQNTAIILYWILAVYRPALLWVYVANSYEQFSYGLGVSAYTVFLMRTVMPEFKASHYAITTAFMAAGVLVPQIFSGYLQAWLGYQNYFFMSFLVAIPGLVTIFFLPLEDKV